MYFFFIFIPLLLLKSIYFFLYVFTHLHTFENFQEKQVIYYFNISLILSTLYSAKNLYHTNFNNFNISFIYLATVYIFSADLTQLISKF